MNRFLQNRRWKRISILLAVICLLHITLFSGAFLAHQMNHEHRQHDYGCSVCVSIRLVESLIRQMSTALRVMLIMPIFLLGLPVLNIDVTALHKKTLVELSVRMDN